MAKKKYVFTITTGRSGTVYSTELFKANCPDAAVYHERTGWLAFGQITPDCSHFTYFNSVGNAANVRKFWERKFAHDLKTSKDTHVEFSHFLAKAGLMENLDLLLPHADVDVVILKRDTFDIVWSYYNRFDFANAGFTWMFSLDPRYPNVIVKSDPFRKMGMVGSALWYTIEMFTRAAYYKKIMEGTPGLRFHEVSLKDITKPEGARKLIAETVGLAPDAEVIIPPRQNETKSEFFGEKVKQDVRTLVDRTPYDPEALAQAYIDSGARLGTVKNMKPAA